VAFAWTAVTIVGVLVFEAGRNAPAHRFLSFFLPVPILIAAAVLAAGRFAGSWSRRWGGWVRIGVVTFGVLALGTLGYRAFYVQLPADRGVEWLDTGKIHDALAASAYLDAARIPMRAPIVFVVDDTGPNPLSFVPEMAYMVRSVLPADRTLNAHFYVGDPERYLAGQPTYRPNPPTYDQNENRFWPDVRALLPRKPVALLLASFNPAFARVAAAHPDWTVAPGVIALHGPRPAVLVPAPPLPAFPYPAGLAFLGAITFGSLVVIGAGWALALLPRLRLFETMALSPAFGIAALVLFGVVMNELGLSLGGALAVLVGPVAAVVGLALAARRLRRGGKSRAPTVSTLQP
jgi:hypothetical protein